MVLVWSLSQHVGKRVTCLPASVTVETTKRLLQYFGVICQRCHALGKHSGTGLMWRKWPQIHCRLNSKVTEGTNRKTTLWRQQALCVTMVTNSSNRSLQQHKSRPSFKTDTNQDRNAGWITFSAENRYFYNKLRQDEKYRDYLISAIDRKSLDDFHEKMLETNKMYNAFDYHFMNFCTNAIASGATKNTDLYETQLSRLIGLIKRLIREPDIDAIKVLCMVRRYHKFANETIDSAFSILLQTVSKELCNRISTMSAHDIFRVADLLYSTGLHRNNVLIKAVIQRCMSDLDIINIPEQRILFFFYVGLERLTHRGLTMEIHDQEEMVQVLDKCNINEIGVVALGMFRAEIQIKSEKLGLLIVKKLEENFHSCHSIVLSAILKFIEFTIDRRLCDKFPAIYGALTDRMFIYNVAKAVSDKRVKNMPWFMRVCRLYSSIRFCPEEVLQAVISKILETDAGHMRLKDIAEILRFFNFGNNHQGIQEVYAFMKNELLHRDTEEFEKHPVHTAMAISALINAGVYPLSLVELLFCEEWLKKSEGKKFYFSRLPYVISESVKLERPDYIGPLLPSKYSDKVCEQHWYLQEIEHSHFKAQAGDGTLRAQFTMALEEALESFLGGKEYFNMHAFLPHFFTPDIGIAVNESGKVLPVTAWCTTTGHIKPSASPCTRFQVSVYRTIGPLVSSPELKAHRIVIVPLIERDALFTFMDIEGNKTQYMVSKTLMKLRQLKLLGFNVVHIFQKEFAESENKQDLLREKLSPFLGKSLSTEKAEIRDEPLQAGS